MESDDQLIRRGLQCPSCNIPTVLRHKKDASGQMVGRFYICPQCGAMVNCHQGTERAMGSVASSDLRRLRHIAHIWFDGIWRNKLKKSRYNAYSWLALRLEMNKNDVHMGTLSEKDCIRVIAICSNYIRRHRPDVWETLSREAEQWGA